MERAAAVAAETSLQIVRAAETTSLIEKTKTLASPEERAQLERLAAKVAPKATKQ
ncbi:MAG: hypothetical protein HY901_16975 [Deltaproteobacteria bacterium]|nr:hypothetical protein [Deltaproteobacteria bacterium]